MPRWGSSSSPNKGFGGTEHRNSRCLRDERAQGLSACLPNSARARVSPWPRRGRRLPGSIRPRAAHSFPCPWLGLIFPHSRRLGATPCARSPTSTRFIACGAWRAPTRHGRQGTNEMVEALRTSWWRRRRPDLAAAASRFPLPVLIAGLLTFYRLNHDFARDVDMRVMGALVASFLWAVAVDFFIESGRRPFAARVALWIAGIAAIAALFHFFWELWVSPHLLLGALLILVGLAAYLGRQGSNAAFWLFNHRLWLGAALAAVGAGLFAA